MSRSCSMGKMDKLKYLSLGLNVIQNGKEKACHSDLICRKQEHRRVVCYRLRVGMNKYRQDSKLLEFFKENESKSVFQTLDQMESLISKKL